VVAGARKGEVHEGLAVLLRERDGCAGRLFG
jgi:hypothetical protein